MKKKLPFWGAVAGGVIAFAFLVFGIGEREGGQEKVDANAERAGGQMGAGDRAWGGGVDGGRGGVRSGAPTAEGGRSDGARVAGLAGGKGSGARIVTKKGVLDLGEGNGEGWFPTVRVEAGERVDVVVSYPDGEIGEEVVVQAEDGGVLDGGKTGGKMADVVALDGKRQLAFGFSASEQRGTHKVRLVRMGEQRLLDFWVGEPLEYQRK